MSSDDTKQTQESAMAVQGGLTWSDFLARLDRGEFQPQTPAAQAASDAWWASLPPIPSLDAEPAAWAEYIETMRLRNERSRLVRMPPDGRTFHLFDRPTAAQEWSYQAFDAADLARYIEALQAAMQAAVDLHLLH